MAKQARVDIRMSEEHKAVLEQAAAATGQPLTSFMVSSLLERARAILSQETSTRLSRRDMRRLLKILEEDDEPGPALRAAARRFKARYAF